MKHQQRILLLHYTIVCLLILTGGLAVVLLPSGPIQTLIMVSLAALYVIWGVWHHYEERTLSRHIIMEYTGVMAIIVIILMML